jgi:hypothetical protein
VSSITPWTSAKAEHGRMLSKRAPATRTQRVRLRFSVLRQIAHYKLKKMDTPRVRLMDGPRERCQAWTMIYKKKLIYIKFF